MKALLQSLGAIYLIAVLAACSSVIEVADKSQPLTLDPGVLSGQLDNGFRYYLRSTNSAPENDRLELRLIVKAGSLHERVAERGYAHLVEHMAYRGTRSFSAGKIESMLSGNGLRWGNDINATTHYGATVYRFSLHRSDEALVPVVLELMSEWLDSITFDPAALAKEKRIVGAEIRERYGSRSYIVDPVIASAYSGTRYENRQPSGDMDIVRTATAAGLRQFWESHYRADNAVLVITGGAKPWRFEPMINSVFANLPGASQAKPAVNKANAVTFDYQVHNGGVKLFKDGTLIELVSGSDPTLSLPQLSVNLISQLQAPPTDAKSTASIIRSRFRSHLLLSAFSHLLRDRITSTQECSAVKLSASLLESGQSVEHLTMTLTEKDVLSCLSVASGAIQAVKKSRLTEEEFAEFKQLFDQIVQISVEQYRSRNANALASALVDMVTNGEYALPSWALQKLLEEVAVTIDRVALDKMISDIDETHRLVISAVSNTQQVTAMTDMIAAVDRPHTGSTRRVGSTVVHGAFNPDQTKYKLPLLKSSSQAAFVKVHSEGSYHEWRLANGATVILLRDADYDHVAMTAISAGGYAQKTKLSATAAMSLPAYLSVNGLGGYASRSLRNFRQQKHLYVEPFVEPLHHGISASGEASELPTMLSMVRSYFDEPLILEPHSSTFINQLKASKSRPHLNAVAGSGMYVKNTVSSQLDKDLFLTTHRELFGSTGGFGFVFVGLVEPDQLEREMLSLFTADAAPQPEFLKLADNRIDNTVLLNHGEKATDVTVILSCAGDSKMHLSTGTMDQFGDQSLQSWQLLSDVVAERLRYALREEPGLVYEIDSDVLASKQLVHQLGFSVRPEDEDVALSLVSKVLSEVSLNGIAAFELRGALARQKRYSMLDAAGHEVAAMRKAKQWLYSGTVRSESSGSKDYEPTNGLQKVNRLARCLGKSAQQVVLNSYESFKPEGIVGGAAVPVGGQLGGGQLGSNQLDATGSDALQQEMPAGR